ncbi:MAG: hypothetical protein V4710_10390 [Verrucomicrobiota bacterium]
MELPKEVADPKLALFVDTVEPDGVGGVILNGTGFHHDFYLGLGREAEFEGRVTLLAEAFVQDLDLKLELLHHERMSYCWRCNRATLGMTPPFLITDSFDLRQVFDSYVTLDRSSELYDLLRRNPFGLFPVRSEYWLGFAFGVRRPWFAFWQTPPARLVAYSHKGEILPKPGDKMVTVNLSQNWSSRVLET